MRETIGVGVLGHAFMGRAHARAYRSQRELPTPPALLPELVAIAGRDAAGVTASAERYGFADAVTDWRALIADDRIGLVDVCGPNALHAEPTIAAAEAGRHVACEKPLGRDAEEALETWRRVAVTGVVHLCAFNYRFLPAVRLARELIADGELGELRDVRMTYEQDWLADPGAPPSWRTDAAQAGAGALGDLGSHLVDLARYLVGEVAAVCGRLATYTRERGGRRVDVDDAFWALATFQGGATGALQASRVARGRRNALAFEIHGSRASLAFDLERLNELAVYRDGGRAAGFTRVLVTDAGHPFADQWWPPGHTLGWEHSFVAELGHLLDAIAVGGSVRPHGADLEDGYRAAAVCDAIARSHAGGRWERLTYA